MGEWAGGWCDVGDYSQYYVRITGEYHRRWVEYGLDGDLNNKNTSGSSASSVSAASAVSPSSSTTASASAISSAAVGASAGGGDGSGGGGAFGAGADGQPDLDTKLGANVRVT